MHKLVTADNVFIDARLNYETKKSSSSSSVDYSFWIPDISNKAIILQACFGTPCMGDQPFPRPPAIRKVEQNKKELPSGIRTRDLQ